MKLSTINFSNSSKNSGNTPGPKRPGFLEGILGLLGAGILGTVIFVVMVIVLSPLLLVFGIYLLIVRYRMKKALKQMMGQIQDAAEGLGPDAEASFVSGEEGQPRKHVNVTVTTVEPDEK
ncbi:MAG: hypothetical protein K8S55_11555 [Phycisphaerae bacterium]|nr:hypothetical protein [Phycisphaerae bacterium]